MTTQPSGEQGGAHHPSQPHEHLLVGWIKGGTTIGDDDDAKPNANGTSTSTANTGQDNDRDKGETTMPMAPDPSAMHTTT
jgi:hypothetical protein